MSVNCFIRLATEAGIKSMSSFSKGCTFYLKSDVYKIAQIGSLPLSLKENLSPRAVNKDAISCSKNVLDHFGPWTFSWFVMSILIWSSRNFSQKVSCVGLSGMSWAPKISRSIDLLSSSSVRSFINYEIFWWGGGDSMATPTDTHHREKDHCKAGLHFN